jgi:hypothetical protein
MEGDGNSMQLLLAAVEQSECLPMQDQSSSESGSLGVGVEDAAQSQFLVTEDLFHEGLLVYNTEFEKGYDDSLWELMYEDETMTTSNSL